MPLNLLDLPEDRYFFNFKKENLISEDTIYTDGLCFIFRLLTPDEIRMLERFLPNMGEENERDFALTTEVEEEVVKLCVEKVVGYDNINFLETEAGITSVLAKAIIQKSISHVANPFKYIDNYMASTSLIEQIQLVVSRFYNIPWSEMKNMPIDTLFRKFAVFQKTFPKEGVSKPEEQEANE